jgi:preprotein translocase subunit SecF
MTGTAIAAMMSIVVVAAFVQMETIMQIALVLVAGLSADFFTTWFVNVAILKWYVGRDKKSRAPRFKLSLFRS